MFDPTTMIGGGARRFPSTCWTVVLGAKDPASAEYKNSIETLAKVYWKPIYGHFRRRWQMSNEEAKDFTQRFFAALCEKDLLQNVTPKEGRFRSYVMTALDNFVRHERRDAGRLKRGGGAPHFSIDVNDGVELSSDASPERAFLRDWAKCLLSEALEEMEAASKAAGRDVAFQIFHLRDISQPKDADLSYEGLAARFGIDAKAVTYHLFRARSEFRDLLLRKVADTVSTPEDAEAELRELFEALRP